MNLNLSALSQITSKASALGNLILASPQSDAGIVANTVAGENDKPEKFLFHVKGEEFIDLDSDITDHAVEDNSMLQDHIALKPETIQCSGFIAELNDVTPDILLPVKIAAEKLSVISEFTPGLSVTAMVAYNKGFQAYQLAKLAQQVGVSAWGSLSGKSNQSSTDGNAVFPATQNAQQVAFAKFYAYRRKRRLFTVQTPWAIFQNCAIVRLRASQGEDTDQITSFNITFKPINFAKTVSISASVFNQGRALQQSFEGSPANLGESLGTPTDYTAKDLFSGAIR